MLIGLQDQVQIQPSWNNPKIPRSFSSPFRASWYDNTATRTAIRRHIPKERS